MGDDHRVHGEGRAGRWQTVVSPLAGQDASELGGAEAGIQVRLRGSGGCSSACALNQTKERRHRPGNHPLNEAHGRPRRRAANILEVTMNGSGLLGECGDQVSLVAVRIAADAQVEARVDEPVVGVRHTVPLQLATGEVVEVGAGSASGADLPDVVHSHIPGGAVSPEGVSESTRLRVPLQDENPFAGGTCQQSCACQPSDTRADHDDVVGHGCSSRD